MRRSKPLPDHPEFSIIEHLTCREFRVENWRLARDGSRKVLRFYGWSYYDALFPLAISILWPKAHADKKFFYVLLVAVLIYAYHKCTRILWESVIAIPLLGIQLETHRGLPGLPLSVSRNFIPMSFLRDFIINEGLHGWNVRYYLAAIKEQDQVVTLHVAFENILPYFPVLLEVYHGVQEMMFEETSTN
ncbi:hypothetical protein K474DRAFT_1654910 [Panus rudis PR-1116 ss-1]|nr:hypothetical protein K474DRAFT_1654910 [Panus rudis PR-1116 ss-1]